MDELDAGELYDGEGATIADRLAEQEDALDAVGAAFVSLARALLLAGVKPRDLKRLLTMAIQARP